MKARDLMTPNPEVITPDEPTYRAAELMRDLDVGFIPVVDDPTNRRLVGVITDRDIAVRCVAGRCDLNAPVAHHMTSEDIDRVSPETDSDEVMRLMQRDQVRRIPVVEEDGRLLGVISQADLVLRAGPQEPEKVEETIERISEPTHRAGH